MMDRHSTMRGAMLLGPEHIEIRELPVPRPGPGELLLAIRAATTCGTDVKVFKRGGHPRMLEVPTLFGHEMAGTVAEIGEGVTQFGVGDAVAVANSAPCGQCIYCRMERENLCQDLHYINGAFAEYLLVPERFVTGNTHPIPAGLDFALAALTEPLACALHGIDACELERFPSDSEIVIFGAGPIGLLFVAALARRGFRVLLADPNPSRLEVGHVLGAVNTLAVERGGGQAKRIRALTEGGEGVFVAIDCTGVPEVWSDVIGSVRPGGLVNFFGGCAPDTHIELDTHQVHYSELTLKGVYHHRPATVRAALELLSADDFPAKQLLSDEAPIEQVEQALRSMMSKQNLKVVIRSDATTV
ncbi:MAG: dehydrogenase [Thiotrichales bacterium]|nr:dehydrogenase [Thiotrichales bacterium]